MIMARPATSVTAEPPRPKYVVLLVLAMGMGFAVAAWLSVRHVNPLSEEMAGHGIAVALVNSPLAGRGMDGPPARLPMYLTAAVYAVVGPSLPAARLLSIAAGAAAIVLTFVAGRRWFGPGVGLLAAALLAMSPYFLNLARTAMTEGDAMWPAATLIMLLAFDTWMRRRQFLILVVFGVTLGLALAVQLLTVLMVPALIMCDLLNRRERQMLATTERGAPVGPVPRGALRGWSAAALLAAVVCVAICPPSVLAHEIRRALTAPPAPPDTVPMVRFLDPLRLYLGMILIKPGLPLGLLVLGGLGWAWRRSTDRPALRLLVATSGLCLLLLMTLPARRPSWLMGIYPLLMLILIAFVVHTARSLGARPRAQSAWIAFAATGCLYLAWGTVQSWPDFGLYGYRVVGNTWLGAESRGYRNLIQVTNDGTMDALRWCTQNVPPGRRVVSYLWDDHVIDAFVAAHPLDFELIRRRVDESPGRGPPIDGADYLIVSLNNEVTWHDLPPADLRTEYFEPLPVHVIWRGGNGYRLPFVQIYERRSTIQSSAETQGASP